MNICAPRLGYDFSEVSCLKDLKEGNQLYNLLQYALSQCDRELYMRLRTGILTLTQVCSRIEFAKSGMRFICLDDIIHTLPQSVLDGLNNPDYGSKEIFAAKDLEV